MYDIELKVSDFISKFPCFEKTENEHLIVLKGLYHLRVEFKEIYLEDYFELIINVDKKGKCLPIVYETRRIERFHHKFTDGSLCLGIPMELSIDIKKTKYDLVDFFNKYVIPYLYGYLYYEVYGVMPFGERSHGRDGYIEYFMDIFGLSSKEQMRGFLAYLMNNKTYRGHHLCPCGSHKRIRDCHKDVLFHYFNEQNEVVLNEIKKYLEDMKNVKK